MFLVQIFKEQYNFFTINLDLFWGCELNTLKLDTLIAYILYHRVNLRDCSHQALATLNIIFAVW